MGREGKVETSSHNFNFSVICFESCRVLLFCFVETENKILEFFQKKLCVLNDT